MKTTTILIIIAALIINTSNAQFDCESLGKVKGKMKKLCKKKGCAIKKGLCVSLIQPFPGDVLEPKPICFPNKKCLRFGGKCFNPLIEKCDGKSVVNWCKGARCSCCIPRRTPKPTFPAPPMCKQSKRCEMKRGKCMTFDDYEIANADFNLVFSPKDCPESKKCGCVYSKPTPKPTTKVDPTPDPTPSKKCEENEECRHKGGKCVDYETCKHKFHNVGFEWNAKMCHDPVTGANKDCGCCIPKKEVVPGPFIPDFDFDTKLVGNDINDADDKDPDFGLNKISIKLGEFKTRDGAENQCAFNWKKGQKSRKGYLGPCRKSLARGSLPCPECEQKGGRRLRKKKISLPTDDLLKPDLSDISDIKRPDFNLNYNVFDGDVAYNNDQTYIKPMKMFDFESLIKAAEEEEDKPRFTHGFTPRAKLQGAGRNLGVIWGKGQFDKNEDDRVEITNCNRHPYNKVVRILYSNGGVCTGTLVGPKHVLTAGHCLHEDPNEVANAGWLDVVGIVRTPCGSSTSTPTVRWRTMHSVLGWTRDGSSDWDYGLITLQDRDVNGNSYSFGWMSYGYKSNLPESYTWNLNGFPADCPWFTNPSGLTGDQPTPNSCWWDGWELAHDYDATHSINSKQIYHLVDTQGGQSGSGLYAYFTSSGKRVIYGVHYGYYGSVADYNGARRIDKSMFYQLCGWINDSRVC